MESNQNNEVSNGNMNENDDQEDYNADEAIENSKFDVNLLILGECTVGKTCMLLRFMGNKFEVGQKPTVGVDFRAKQVKVNEELVTLRMWDSAGQERFHSITQQFYKNSDGIILVYDVANKDTYDKLGKWLEDIKQQKKEHTKLFFVGNKIDLERVVSNEIAVNYAKKEEVDYFETSAKTGEGIDSMFQTIAEKLYDLKKDYKSDNEESKKLGKDQNMQKKKCSGCC